MKSTEDTQQKLFKQMLEQDPYEVSAKSLTAIADEMKQVAGEASQNLLNARDYIKNLDKCKSPSHKVVCAHCGKQLTMLELLVSTGQPNTDLIPVLHNIGDIGRNIKRNLPVIEFETSWENWQDKSIKETALDKIKCPFCHEFPFDDKTVYVKHVAQIVLFQNVKPVAEKEGSLNESKAQMPCEEKEIPMEGNQMKMRVALESIVNNLERRLFLTRPSSAMDEWMWQKAKEALAEPPRNCDRFGDELDAQLTFLNEEWLISVDKDSMVERDRFENWTDEMRSAYARWLMAKAEGKETKNEVE